jgi:hypothetical protein
MTPAGAYRSAANGPRVSMRMNPSRSSRSRTVSGSAGGASGAAARHPPCTSEWPTGQPRRSRGVDYESSTKSELYERARQLGVERRSRTSKKELARAIAREQ